MIDHVLNRALRCDNPGDARRVILAATEQAEDVGDDSTAARLYELDSALFVVTASHDVEWDDEERSRLLSEVAP